jgi:hypothetical protein
LNDFSDNSFNLLNEEDYRLWYLND